MTVKQVTLTLDVKTGVKDLLGSLISQADGLQGILLAPEFTPEGPLSTLPALSLTVHNSHQTSTISQGVSALISGIQSAGTALPNPAHILLPLTQALEVVESIAQQGNSESAPSGNIADQLNALAGQLAETLKSSRSIGFASVLLKMADALAASKEGNTLLTLLGTLTQRVGAPGASSTARVGDFAQAINTAVTLLGALMSLETQLSELDRLTGVMGNQLDEDAVQKNLDALRKSHSFQGISLAEFIDSIDVENPAQLAAVTAAITACGTHLRALETSVTNGMAFGEATLAYLNLDQIQAGVAVAAANIRNTSLAPVTQFAQWMGEKISPLMQLDLTMAPAQTLDDLITQLEASVQDIAEGLIAFDTDAIRGPMSTVLGRINSISQHFQAALTQISLTLEGVLDQVQALLESLPIDTLIQTIQTAIQPLVEVLEKLAEVAGTVQDALNDSVGQALQILEGSTSNKSNNLEYQIDKLKSFLETTFSQAETLLKELNLDQHLGQVAGNVKQFAALVSKAQLGPVFDTAIGVIGDAADIIEEVPFNLMPSSMMEEVKKVSQPIKATDLAQVQQQIEAILELKNGKFALRPELEQSLAGVQAQYDAIVTQLKEFDPRNYATEINSALASVTNQLRSLSPSLGLDPLQACVDSLHDAADSLELQSLLIPLTQPFESFIDLINQFDPTQLITPLKTRLDAARSELIDLIHLDEWNSTLDGLRSDILTHVNALNPLALKPKLEAALLEAHALLNALPSVHLATSLGDLIALLAGGKMKLQPRTFDAVLEWLFAPEGSGKSATDALAGRTRRAAQRLEATLRGVAAIDPQALVLELSERAEAISRAVSRLPGFVAEQLWPLVEQLDPKPVMGALIANRSRYLQVLAKATEQAERLSHTGFSEANVLIAQLKQAFTPVLGLQRLLRSVLTRIGIRGVEEGIPGMLKNVLAVVSPSRIVGIVMPLFEALHGQCENLLGAVLDPLKNTTESLQALINALDLQPLHDACSQLFASTVQKIESFNPLVLLEDVIGAAHEVKASVAAFDPLKPIEALLEGLQKATTRILQKLDGNTLLASPIRSYDRILKAISALDLQSLMKPILDLLDSLAVQVEEGLSGTVTAFKRLQDALPSGGGIDSVSVSIV